MHCNYSRALFLTSQRLRRFASRLCVGGGVGGPGAANPTTHTQTSEPPQVARSPEELLILI